MDDWLPMWRDPHARHAMLVHLPIAVGLLGVLPIAWAAATRFRIRTPVVIGLVLFLLCSAGAWFAADAGRDAAAAIEARQDNLTITEKHALATHKERGGVAWVWPLIPAALLSASLARPPLLRAAAGSLALIAAAGVAVWFGIIGHVGGQLVYTHGLGVPARAAPPTQERASVPTDP